jgi:hypothetical protein
LIGFSVRFVAGQVRQIVTVTSQSLFAQWAVSGLPGCHAER